MGCGHTKDMTATVPEARRPCPIEQQCGGVAAEYAECTVCFEPLCDMPCAMLHKNGARVCRHLIHQRCAESMQCAGNYTCPECRGPFDTASPLPRLGACNPREWFAAVDVDGDQRLDKNEVLTVLKAQYRLDWRQLEEHLDGELWQLWDQDGSGDLKFEELFADTGLIAYITGDHVAKRFAADTSATSRAAAECPALENTAAWFRYWDTDSNGTLDIQEVQRALMKTFNLGKEMHRVHTMRETLDAVWPIFDLDGNGEIDFQEFTAPNGLGETLALSVAMLDRKLPNVATATTAAIRLRRMASQPYLGPGWDVCV